MKKIFALLISVFALVVGCAAPVSNSAGSQTSGSGQNITLRFAWWGSDDRNQATMKALQLYHQLHPNITIQGEPGNFDTFYQKLLTQLASKTAPDIVQTDYKWVGDLIRQGKPLVNINDFTKSKLIDLSNFPLDKMQGYLGQGDYMIGVPVGINGRGILYNADFFKKFGITPDNNWDWNKVLEVGAKVNQQDPNAHLMYFEKNNGAQIVLDWIKQKYGVDMFKDDYTMVFNEQDLVDIFTIVKRLVDTGTVPPFKEMAPYDSVYPEQVPNWLNGQWGMVPLVSSNIPPVAAASKFQMGTMRALVQPGAKNSGITISPTQLLSINNDSPYKDEAAKFINWYLNDDQAIMITKDTRGVPANTRAEKLLVDKGLLNAQVSSMLEQALAQPGSAEVELVHNAQLTDITIQYIYKVGFGNLTPQAAAHQAMQDYQRVLDQLKKGSK